MQSALIIDDSKFFRSVVKIELSGLFGKILEAASLGAARDVLAGEEVDYIILDRELPDGDGIDFCAELKKESHHQLTNIVMVSSDDREEVRTKAFEAGAFGFFVKNFIEGNLHSYIENLTHMRHMAPFRGKTAVVIEDSSVQLSYITALLKQIRLNVIGLHTHDAAVAFFKEEPKEIDIILTDYILDGTHTATDIIASVRGNKKYHQIPIVAITGSSDKAVKKNLFIQGVNDFLEKPFDPEEFYLRINAHLRNKAFFDILKEKNYQLTIQSITDPLTGLYNRRHLYDTMKGYEKQSTPYSLILFDIDHFKKVNDVHGHDCGDEVLKGVALMMKSALGEDMLAARFGGEEFIFLLASATKEQATAFAESFRKTLESRPFPCLGRAVTCSLGVSVRSESEGHEQVIALSDARLYYAKQNGRNRVENTLTASKL